MCQDIAFLLKKRTIFNQYEQKMHGTFIILQPKSKSGHSHKNLSLVDLELLCSQTVPGRSTLDLITMDELIKGESRNWIHFFWCGVESLPNRPIFKTGKT